MRPKKVILCMNENEQELSVLSFLLATHGYRVLAANGTKEAIGFLTDNLIDLVLVDMSMTKPGGDHVAGQLKRSAPHVPVMLLGDPQKVAGQPHAADAFVSKRNCSTQELLERVKTMSARKRGPRKGTQRVAHSQELAVAS